LLSLSLDKPTYDALSSEAAVATSFCLRADDEILIESVLLCTIRLLIDIIDTHAEVRASLRLS
jgi:hypothetical protein